MQTVLCNPVEVKAVTILVRIDRIADPDRIEIEFVSDRIGSDRINDRSGLDRIGSMIDRLIFKRIGIGSILEN
jgi:hypothetical protein